MEYISIKDVCKIFNISRPTLDKLRKQGLPSYKIDRAVRFDKEEVIEWFKKNNKL